MTGAEVLLRTLLAHGVEVCFANPGTSEMHFVAALDRVPAMRGVLCLFEGVCSGAADGYARMTGRPAATLLHLGPGLANGLANFHNARKARTPIVSLIGEHSTRHLAYDAPLTADIAAFAATVSPEVHRLESAAAIGPTTARVIAAARRYPGRIAHLIIPADFSWSEGGPIGEPVPPAPPPAPAVPPQGGAGNWGLLLGGQTAGERGLALASRLAAAGWRVLIDRNAARVAMGRGGFQPERIAYFPGPAQVQLAGLTDLALVEAKAPVSFFGYPDEASYLTPPECRVHELATPEQDGLAALAALAANLPAEPGWADPPPLPPPPPGPLTLAALGQAIAALLPPDAIVSDEMVSSGPPVLAALRHAPRFDYLPVTGGSIGQGLPVAVGAAIACPGRKVVVLEGDGSALYTPQAWWTMAREKLDIVTVIFANRRYQILDVEMRRTGANGFGGRAGAIVDIGTPPLDFVGIAEGLGVAAVRVETVEAFLEHFARCMREPGPSVIEAMI